MAKNVERIFIKNARLSFPALDEPKETMKGNNELKYQASFILERDNPCVKDIRAAIGRLAQAEWKDRAKQVLANPDKLPLKDGNRRSTPGYENMLYISAKSKNQPDLLDANPKHKITDAKEIREKFQAGYRVNGYVDLFPYEFSGMRGIGAGLVSVQFAAYDEVFSGVSKPKADDYPDCTEQAAGSMEYENVQGADTSFNPSEYDSNDGDDGISQYLV